MPKDPKDELGDVPHTRSEPRPDFSKPPPPAKLPKSLQETLDNEEKLWEVLYEGRAKESTDSSIRYAGYAARIRTILASAHRYVAYTSDIGESFRPVAHPYLVRGAYGISWAYIAGDVAHEGYKAYLRNQRALRPAELLGEASLSRVTSSDKHAAAQAQSRPLGPGVTGPQGTATATATTPVSEQGRIVPIEDYRAVMAQRAVFQSIASMGLPAFTIHSVVKYAGRAVKDVKNQRIRTYGPIGLGLAVVPLLPYVLDEPVERAVEWTFHKGFEFFGGPGAVGHRPATGRNALTQAETREGAAKEKEL